MLRINGPTLAILERCDGRRPLRDIVTGSEAAFGATGLEQDIIGAITRLAAAQVLVIEADAAATHPSRPPVAACVPDGRS